MEIIREIEQGSKEWHDLRLGVVTASRMKDLLTNGRNGQPSKTAESYMFELIAEKLTGEPKPFFENDAMRWGTETEEIARVEYELFKDIDVEQVAFIRKNEFIGVSPDGLIGGDGMLEIKCPTTSTQLKRALTESYSKDYTAQIQCQLWVAEREWCDFLSYDPRLNCDARFLLERVYRDEVFIKNMETKTNEFIEKMNELLTTLNGEK